MEEKNIKTSSAWERARALVNMTYQFIKRDSFKTDQILSDQFKSASISLFLSVSDESALSKLETESWIKKVSSLLTVALDQKYITFHDQKDILLMLDEIQSLQKDELKDDRFRKNSFFDKKESYNKNDSYEKKSYPSDRNSSYEKKSYSSDKKDKYFDPEKSDKIKKFVANADEKFKKKKTDDFEEEFLNEDNWSETPKKKVASNNDRVKPERARNFERNPKAPFKKPLKMNHPNKRDKH